MQNGKIFRTLAIVIILSLLVAVIPAEPVLAAPLVTVSPASGAIGTRVTVTGTNFGSYIGDTLRIFFNKVEITDSPKTVPATGDFEAHFNIPGDAVPGTAWVTVKGPIGSVLAESPFVIQKTEIYLDIKEGSVGTAVRVTGRGFYASTIVAFYYYFNGVTDTLGTADATPVGECTYNFIIPRSTAGPKKISASNAEGNSAQAQFRVTPSAILNPTSGPVGTRVDVTGTGFGRTTEIAVYFGDEKVAYASTDPYGSFEGAFKVPSIKAANYPVKIEDRDGNLAWLEFAIAAYASLDKTTGSVGTAVGVSGSGFVAGSTVVVKYDDIILVTALADDDGTFSATFDVPVSAAGKHTVTVSDGTDTRQLDFTMESKAPPAPTLQLPETDAEVEVPLAFHWADVDDPSLPVAYDLQVASDENFTDILVDRQRLTEPVYTLTEEEELRPNRKGAPYYWRVKASDGAANESEWSTPESFNVTSPALLPTWAIILLIVVGSLVVVFLIWRLARARRYSDEGA